MFEQERNAPLWMHVAGGVAVGMIVAGVVLYSLWLWQTHVAMERAARELQRTLAASVVKERVVVRPPTVIASTPGRAAAPCPAGYALGVLNGAAVCVSPTGQVIDVVK